MLTFLIFNILIGQMMHYHTCSSRNNDETLTFLVNEDLSEFLSDNCKIVINELNIDDPQKPEKKEYIELKVRDF